MDSYAVAALAHVRVLLVPIGSISKRTFDQWAAEIRTIDAIRLSDIPPGTKDEKGGFNLSENECICATILNV